MIRLENFQKNDCFDQKLISLILRALPTFKDVIVIYNKLPFITDVFLDRKKTIWIPPSISIREMLNSFNALKMIPIQSPAENQSVQSPLPCSKDLSNLHPTVFCNWWHFRELDPTLRIQEKSSKISSKRRNSKNGHLIGQNFEDFGKNFVAGDWLPEKVISPAHSRTNSSPVIIVIVNSHLFGFKRLTF